jgi:hypothetical protein
MFGVLLMIATGIGTAMLVMGTIAVAQRKFGAPAEDVVSDRGRIASSILFDLMLAGGDRPDEAMRDIRRVAGLAGPVASSIDMTSWGERFAQLASDEQRNWLLDIAVQLVAGRGRPLPLRQYSRLLDLSFALGFQTDALAKLRDKYGFEYVDPAKHARPREADRAGGATTFFVRSTSDDDEPLLRILGLGPGASRQTIISTYRKLAAQHHPDKVFGQSQDVQAESAARFIEITRAYEKLLATIRD